MPTAVVVFGATGDLAKRRLMPALAKLQRKVILVGAGRREKSTEGFREGKL